MREKSESERKILGMFLVFITVTSVFAGFVPVVAQDQLGEDGMPIPSAMTLIANPEWIYINGDESLIIATVYDHANYTVPIPNMVVYFETDLGLLRNVSYGDSITETECWAVTNESGVAIAAVMPVEGSAAGNATVKAVTGKGDVWKQVTVEFVKAEWRVVLFPDALSKATAVNEDVTYTIRVRNAGTAADTYTLSIPVNEADHAVLNETSVSLAANTSEFVTLTVRDSAMGRYNTTVRAASPHASWEVTLLTIVREYGVNLTVEGGDHAEKTVAPGVPATYRLTVENTGSDTDSYDLSVENLDGAAVAQLNRTSVLNLAAGAKADILLTVSDPDESAYRVNVFATSQGHPATGDTVSTITTVLIPLEPDLIITEIALNCGYLFGNQSNEFCATVKNNGTAAAGPFNLSFNIGVFYVEARVAAGLAPAETTVVCVTDPTLRSAGLVRTLLVTADCDAEVDESNEDNNERSIVATVVNNGYKGKRFTGGSDISTRKTFELTGGLRYSVGDSQYLSGSTTPWSTYTVNWLASDLLVPGTAAVKEARLYVPYTWDKVQGMPDNVSLSFNGTPQTRDAFYTDRKGYAGSDYPYGMLAYNVTASFSTGGNTAILTNLNPVAGNPSVRGMLLLVIYEDATELKRTILLNEEFDLLYGGPSACTTPAEATAYVPFDVTIPGLANKSARLITVAPGAGPNEGDLLFNGQTWTDVWNYAGSSQIGIDDRMVTAYLQAQANEARFQSSADYMEASVAILVVSEGVEREPDLTVTAITPNFGLLYANASNEICATVKNLGGADAGAFNVSFAVDGFSEEVRIAGLAAGAETTVCVTDPTLRTAGETVTITVTADSAAEISESDETNNEQSITVTAIEEQPDLTVIAITPTFGQLYANTSNEICATVKNLGVVAAGAFNVSFAVDGFSEEVRIAGLAAGAETMVCVTDPTLRTAGAMVTITVTADSGGEISESNETNNAMSRVETVATGQPDLSDIEILPNFGLLYANASNEICATVKNSGVVAAGAFNVSFAVDGFSEEVRVAGLAAGAETMVCVTDPTWRNAGTTVTITVTADAGGEISESNETNNEQSIIVPVVAKVNGTVAGTITYACNGAVWIADVTVLLTQNGTTIASTTTDGNGNYSFDDVVPGVYSVNASKQRLWNSSAAVMVPASITVIVNLQMLLKGDLNNNCLQADAGDVAMMKDASVGKIPADWRFDLNGNGLNADAGDVAMMKDASVGKIILL